jgi:predicted transposase
MRLFCACERWAYNRLREGASRDAIKQRGQAVFGLNSRYVDDARLRAQTLLESQNALLGIEIANPEEKLRQARRKLRHTEERWARCADPRKAERLRRAANGRRARIRSLEEQWAEITQHRGNGTIRPAVFGGRKLWRRVCKGHAPLEAWHLARYGDTPLHRLHYLGLGG